MKRFTETDKWKDKWFRALQPPSKLLFLYLLDNCNNAGFIEKDFDLWMFHTGMNEEQIQGAYKGLTRGLIEANDWIWLENFLRHQKNLPLNPDNNAHKQIIELVKEREQDFKTKFSKILDKLGANEGLISPIGIGKGKGIGKPTLEDFIYYCTNDLKEYKLNPENIYKSYADNNWHDSKGNKIKNWKTKLRQVWCTDKNKIKPSGVTWEDAII